MKLEYTWKPPRCMDCKSFGHSLARCPKKVVHTPKIVEKLIPKKPAVTVDADGWITNSTKRSRDTRDDASCSNEDAMVVEENVQSQTFLMEEDLRNVNVNLDSDVLTEVPIVQMNGPNEMLLNNSLFFWIK